MKKGFRGTLIFGVLIAALVAFTIYDTQKTEEKNLKKEAESNVVRFPQESIRKIELDARGTQTVLEGDGKTWKVRQPVEDLADTQAVQTLLLGMSTEKTSAIVAEGKDVDLSPYGLKEAVTTVKLTDEGGNIQILRFGSVKAYDGSLYLKNDDEDKVRLVSATWDVFATKPASEFRSKRLFRGDLESSFSTIELAREVPKTDWKLEKVDGAWKLIKGLAGPVPPLSQDAINAFTEQMKALRGMDFVDRSKPVLKKSYLRLKMTPSDAKKPPFTIDLFKSEIAGESIAASSDVPDRISLFHQAAAQLEKSPQDFFDRKAPFAFESKNVGRIEIETPKSTFAYLKTGKTWGFAPGKSPSDGQGGLQSAPDSTKLDELVQRLRKTETIRFLAPKETQKTDSVIRLMTAEGKSIFELRWGPALVEKQADGVEAQIVPAKTSLSDWWLGLSPASISDLVFESPAKK